MRPNLLLRNLRPAHAAAGVLVLIVPGSAVALAATTQPQSPGAIKFTLQKRQLAYGDELQVSGSAPTSDGGHAAQLQFAEGGNTGWRPLASSTIHTDGTFRIIVALRKSGAVRVVDPAPATPRTNTSGGTTASPGNAQATGASAPTQVSVTPRLSVQAKAITELGSQPAHVRGNLLPAIRGRRVVVLGRSGGVWHRLTTARTQAGGRFDLQVTTGTTGERLRVRFAGDSLNTPTSAYAGRLSVLHQSMASWYNDAGNTACGFHAQYGVANRTLPCGTKVSFYYGGRSVTAVVDDRGPFVGGRDWDLNQNTAAALGFNGVDTVWTSL